MKKVINGKVFRYGDNVDTDVICPGRFLELNNPKEIASHAMAGIDPEFPQKVQEGDIIIAGHNFGCGSSREHAAMAIKASGIKAVVAKSFGRIFYRNAINLGLIALVCQDAHAQFQAGERAEIDLATGILQNLTTGQSVACDAITKDEMDMYDMGGMIELYKQKCKELS